mmetsp:Transcript_29208/g.93341  ORF Transcript_29208/g.93341 Transcript_29208/m.93341 type:complete len:335 (+) Transcript_29208:2129-3133(+)
MRYTCMIVLPATWMALLRSSCSPTRPVSAAKHAMWLTKSTTTTTITFLLSVMIMLLRWYASRRTWSFFFRRLCGETVRTAFDPVWSPMLAPSPEVSVISSPIELSASLSLSSSPGDSCVSPETCETRRTRASSSRSGMASSSLEGASEPPGGALGVPGASPSATASVAGILACRAAAPPTLATRLMLRRTSFFTQSSMRLTPGAPGDPGGVASASSSAGSGGVRIPSDPSIARPWSRSERSVRAPASGSAARCSSVSVPRLNPESKVFPTRRRSAAPFAAPLPPVPLRMSRVSMPITPHTVSSPTTSPRTPSQPLMRTTSFTPLAFFRDTTATW